MNDICALVGHSPAQFGICSVCGTQTPVLLVPTRMVSREEMEQMYPKPESSPDQEGA